MGHHSVGEFAHANSDALKYTIASELVHDERTLDHTCMVKTLDLINPNYINDLFCN